MGRITIAVDLILIIGKFTRMIGLPSGSLAGDAKPSVNSQRDLYWKT